MEKLVPIPAQIRNALQNNRVVKLVGELHFSGTHFYVEPLKPPDIALLTTKQVDALNAVANHKKATLELSAIPRQFAQDYNSILQDMLPSEAWPSKVTRRFTFETSLGETRVELGFRDFDSGVRVRLFPPTLGRIIHDYEDGYFVAGNIADMGDPKYHEIIYEGRYVTVNSLSMEQLLMLAEGRRAFPRFRHLRRSLFEKNPAMRQNRAFWWSAHHHTRDMNMMSHFEYLPSGERVIGSDASVGNFDETSYDQMTQKTELPTSAI